MFRIILSCVVVLMGFSIMGRAEARRPPNRETLLKTVVSNYKIDNAELGDALESLTAISGIPIGFIEADRSKEKNNYLITLNKSSVSLEQVLNDLTRQAPTYKWKITDDVINFFPIEDIDKFVEEVLSIRYDSFLIEKSVPRFTLRSSLLKDSRIKNLMSKYEMKAIILQLNCGFSSCYLANAPDSLYLNDLTIKQILNYLLSHKLVPFWRFTMDGKFFSIVF